MASHSLLGTRQTLPTGGQPNRTIREPIQSTAPALSPHRARRTRQEARRCACLQRLYMLDAVRLHAVLSTGTRRFAVRDLQRSGLLPGAVGACGDSQSALPLNPVLCQRTPSGSSIRGSVLYRAGAIPRTTRAGYTPAQVPVQE